MEFEPQIDMGGMLTSNILVLKVLFLILRVCILLVSLMKTIHQLPNVFYVLKASRLLERKAFAGVIKVEN